MRKSSRPYGVSGSERKEWLSLHRFSEESLRVLSNLLKTLFLVVFCCVIMIKLFFPGLSHFPRSEKAEISFSMSDNKTYITYIASISTFLQRYRDDVQINQMNYESCGGKYESKNQHTLSEKLELRLVSLYQMCTCIKHT